MTGLLAALVAVAVGIAVSPSRWQGRGKLALPGQGP
jgi:hypothetical protein